VESTVRNEVLFLIVHSEIFTAGRNWKCEGRERYFATIQLTDIDF